MKILIIDDDPAIITVFETALRRENYEVVSAPDGQSGIEKAKTEKPDLILLDQILPDIKGNDIISQLKSAPETQNLKIAILSNFGQNELVQEALNAGAVDYILKYQIEPSDLVTKVKQIVGEGKGDEPSGTGMV